MSRRDIAYCVVGQLAWLVSAAGAAPVAARVVIVSLDGLRPDAISAEVAPTLTRLCQEGACALYATCDLPAATMTNHATMVTGKVADRHGVIFDFEVPGTIRGRTLFHIAQDAGLRSAFFASKDKLRFLAPPAALETIVIEPLTDVLIAAALNQITSDGPDLLFIHLKDPDSTGHREGWMSEPYFAALTRMDGLVDELVGAAEADLTRPTYFIITADHGGSGTTHVWNFEEIRRVPFIVHGPDVAPGTEIQEEIVSPVDVAPTALALLDVEIPAGLSGRARVTRQADSQRLLVPPVGIPCLILFVPLLGVGWASCRYGSQRSRSRFRRNEPG